MSTNPIPQFRPLTPKDMEEYRKEQEALAAAASAPQNPEITDPATLEDEVPTDPQPPAAPSDEDVGVLKKRIGDKDRYINTLSDQSKTKDNRIAELERQLAEKSTTKYASDEEVADFESKVDTTPILKELIRREAEKIANEKVSGIRSELSEKDKLSKKQLEDVAKLSKAHPDWREYDSGASLHKVFSDWLVLQPIRIQEMADYTATGDMDSAIAVLTMFKAQVQVKTGPNKKPAATNPASRSPADIPADPKGKFDIMKWNKDMDDALRLRNRPLQDKLMAEFKKAQAEGRI